MQFQQLYSSSAGNLYVVTASSGKRLLLECGVRWSQIQKALSYDLTGIVGCLVSHEHSDHCKAIHEVMAAGIDCYMSLGTRRALNLNSHRRAKAFAGYQTVYSVGHGTFKFEAYAAHHDAEDPCYYIVQADGEAMLFAPDTSHITQWFRTPFSIIAIEVSYDKDILQARVDAGTINETLAKRLLTSHQEKSVAMRYLAEFCDLSRCRQIHLLHLSKDNIDAEMVRKEFEREFAMEVLTV